MTEGNELVAEVVPVAASTPTDSGEHHDKVGGWLLFFCVTLVIINPLVTLGITGYALLSLVPVFGRYPGVAAIASLDTVLSLGLAGFSLYAGMRLWGRQPGAVKLATMFLWAGAAYTIVSPFFWLLPIIPQDPNISVLETLLQSWRGLLYYAIWLNYLRTSKRVKSTYPDVGVPA